MDNELFGVDNTGTALWREFHSRCEVQRVGVRWDIVCSCGLLRGKTTAYEEGNRQSTHWKSVRNLPPTSLQSESAKITGNVNLHLNTDSVHLRASYWLNLFLLHQSRGSRSIMLRVTSSVSEKRDFLECTVQRE